MPTLTLFNTIFNIVDIAIAILCFIGAVAGSVKGFALGFSSLAGILIGLLVAMAFADIGTPLIMDAVGLPPAIAKGISIAVCFLAGYLAMMLLGAMLGKTLKALKLEWLNKLLGFFLGIINMLIIVIVALFLLGMQHVVDVSPYVSGSVIVRVVLDPIVPAMVDIVRGAI